MRFYGQAVSFSMNYKQDRSIKENFTPPFEKNGLKYRRKMTVKASFSLL